MYAKSAYTIVQIFPGVLQMIMCNDISSYHENTCIKKREPSYTVGGNAN